MAKLIRRLLSDEYCKSEDSEEIFTYLDYFFQLNYNGQYTKMKKLIKDIHTRGLINILMYHRERIKLGTVMMNYIIDEIISREK